MAYDSLAYGIGQIYKIYLQQSFLRMKIVFKTRMRNPRKEEYLELGAPAPDELEVEAPVADELEVGDSRAENPEAGAFFVYLLADTVEDIIGDGSEGSQFLGIFVGNLDTKFFFDRHEGL
jgi:hypothetical protein